MLNKIKMSKQEVIENFKKGVAVKACSGLWNDPLSHSHDVGSVEEIEGFYHFNCLTEVKKEESSPVLYLHGYSDCDMF